MPQPFSTCFIAFGSNGSDTMSENIKTVQTAMQAVAGISPEDSKKSRLFQTPAFPKGYGPDFVNAVMSVKTDLAPDDVLKTLLQIEADMGRVRNERWTQRKIDLDLIGHGCLVLPNAETYRHWKDLSFEKQKVETPPELILPHPRLQDRAFVLVPLNDVAPDWVHPVLNKTVQALVQDLPKQDLEEVVPIKLD